MRTKEHRARIISIVKPKLKIIFQIVMRAGVDMLSDGTT